MWLGSPVWGAGMCGPPVIWGVGGVPVSPVAVGQGLGRVEEMQGRGVLRGDAHPALHPQHCLCLPHSRLLWIKSLK